MDDLKNLRHRLAALEEVRRISSNLAAELDLSRLLGQIMKAASDLVGAEASSLLLIEGDKLVFWMIHAGSGDALQGHRMSLDEGIAGWVATHNETVIVNDPQHDDRFASRFDLDYAFQTRSLLAAPLSARGRVIGVLEVLNRQDQTGFTQSDLDLITALAAEAAIAIDNARLFEQEQERSRQLSDALHRLDKTYKATLNALVTALDARDNVVGGHTARVVAYSSAIAKTMGLQGENLIAVERGALLHDVGKIGIPDAILRKPGPLTDEEWQLMRQHPEIGARIVAEIDFLGKAAEIVLSHHERWDGSGYPFGLRGEAIPLGARIFAAADIFDAITAADRTYRTALPIQEGIAEIARLAGTQLDPAVVSAFLSCLPDQEAVQSLLLNSPGAADHLVFSSADRAPGPIPR